MLWTMAWRNLWRSQRRTWITVVSVAFGVWLSLTFTGLGEHSYSSLIEQSARQGFGHLSVLPVVGIGLSRSGEKNPKCGTGETMAGERARRFRGVRADRGSRHVCDRNQKCRRWFFCHRSSFRNRRRQCVHPGHQRRRTLWAQGSPRDRGGANHGGKARRSARQADRLHLGGCERRIDQ